MNLFVYSDESGVFDYVHNDYFVFGGLILLGNKAKEDAIRKYISAERILNTSGKYQKGCELKANYITPKEKNKLFRSLNSYYKFAIVINQKSVNEHIFSDKKKQTTLFGLCLQDRFKKIIGTSHFK